MSKKTQSRLKDILPIFLEELEKVEGQMSKLELSNSELDSRIQRLLEHRLELNTESVEKLLKEHKYNLSTAANYLSQSHNNFTTNLKKEKKSLEGLFVQNKERLLEINAGKKDKLTNFYLYTSIAFLVAIWCVAYGVYGHIKLDVITAEYNVEKDRNIELFNFIEDKGHVEEYREWYSRMQEN